MGFLVLFLKKITSVHDAIKKITGGDKSTEASIADETTSATSEVTESSSSQD